jgi:8-oxo-dGTP pyrophosphatase MutT (NUDIX family)
MLFDEQKILLSRRYNTGWMDGCYSLVSGHLDGAESVSQAMIREAREEIGIILTKNNIKPATVIHRKSDYEYFDLFFECRKWKGDPIIAEPEKCNDLQWFSLNKLPQNLLPYILEAIYNYNHKIPFSEYGWKNN